MIKLNKEETELICNALYFLVANLDEAQDALDTNILEMEVLRLRGRMYAELNKVTIKGG